MNSNQAAQALIPVRAAAPTDAAEIARIYNHHVDIGGSTFDAEHWSDDRVSRLIAAPQPDAWFVANQSGGRLLGWASARRFSDRYGYRYTCETAIYLHPEAMGRGIGARLQQRVESHCIASDIHHAVARIIASNERSLAFHEQFGYKLVGIQREIGRLNDRWVDVAILQKIFDPAA